jgi:hypothetical protein
MSLSIEAPRVAGDQYRHLQSEHQTVFPPDADVRRNRAGQISMGVIHDNRSEESRYQLRPIVVLLATRALLLGSVKPNEKVSGSSLISA